MIMAKAFAWDKTKEKKKFICKQIPWWNEKHDEDELFWQNVSVHLTGQNLHWTFNVIESWTFWSNRWFSAWQVNMVPSSEEVTFMFRILLDDLPPNDESIGFFTFPGKSWPFLHQTTSEAGLEDSVSQIRSTSVPALIRPGRDLIFTLDGATNHNNHRFPFVYYHRWWRWEREMSEWVRWR